MDDIARITRVVHHNITITITWNVTQLADPIPQVDGISAEDLPELADKVRGARAALQNAQKELFRATQVGRKTSSSRTCLPASGQA
jgi:hypothetical protein